MAMREDGPFIWCLGFPSKFCKGLRRKEGSISSPIRASRTERFLSRWASSKVRSSEVGQISKVISRKVRLRKGISSKAGTK